MNQSAIQPTFGQRAVGISFNPSQNSDVDEIKRAAADLIDSLHAKRQATDDHEVKRMLSIAITDVQSAQMWGVKAVTWSMGAAPQAAPASLSNVVTQQIPADAASVDPASAPTDIVSAAQAVIAMTANQAVPAATAAPAQASTDTAQAPAASAASTTQ